MYPKILVRYMVIIEILSGILLVSHVPRLSNIGAGFFVFAVAIVLASLFSIPMIRGNGSVAVSLPVLFAASVTLGPAFGAWLGAFATTSLREYKGEVKWPSILFNRAQFGIIGWLAGAIFEGLGGTVYHLYLGTADMSLVIGAFVTFLTNFLLVMTAASLRQHRSLFEVWRVYYKWLTPSFLLMLPIAYLMAVVYRWGGPLPELLFLVPLAGTRWIFVLLRSLRSLYQNGITILLSSLDMRDPYTYGHSVRVGNYAAILARFMRIPEDEVEAIKEAALLHDVGKIGTPDAVLNKPGRLTRDELVVMKRHPVAGGALLTQSGINSCVRDWVLHHHERWDGKGYPDNLKGDDIPLGTRIISVVDAYDAMTTDRPYRKGMGHAEAIHELQTMAGTQFDDVVVRHFVTLCNQINLEGYITSGPSWALTPQWIPTGESSGFWIS